MSIFQGTNMIAGAGGGVSNIDNLTITENANEEIQTVGVIEKNKGLAKYDWVGTLEEYETQNVETLHPDWICYITDDVSGGASVYTKDEVDGLLNSKQNTLIAGTNITITDNTISAAGASMVDIVNAMYPVGSIFVGVTSTCPLAAITGTWELVSSGRVLQGADSGHSAGTTIEAGLPNITGYVISSGVVINSSNYPAKSDGALYLYGGGYKNNSMGSSNNTSGVGLDASRSNSIYGNSSTVQPPAYVVNIWQRTA